MEFQEKSYPFFRDQTESPYILGQGDSCSILSISKNQVIKVPFDSEYDLSGEYRVHADLYCAGVQVSRPFGIYRFRPFNPQGQFATGIVMEKIKGISGTEIDDEHREIVRKELEKQLTLCRDLGFRPFDEGWHNCMFNPESNKLYLIDFQKWESPN